MIVARNNKLRHFEIPFSRNNSLPVTLSSTLIYGMLPLACLLWLLPSEYQTFGQSLLTAVGFCLYQLIAISLGNLLLTLSKKDNLTAGFITSYVLGNLVVGTFLVVIRFGLDFSPLLGVLVLLLLLSAYCFKKSSLGLLKFRPNEWDKIALCLSLAMVLWFYPETLNAAVVSGEHIIVKPWYDYLIFSGHLLMLSEDTVAYGNYTMQGLEHILYHYGIYMASSYLYQLGGLSVFTAISNIMVPMGLSLMFCSIYLLAGKIWGKRVGLLVACLFFLLPDATIQLFEHKWLGTHWLMNASPGMYWGVTVMLLASCFAIDFSKSKDYVPLFFAGGLCLMMPFYRAQFSFICAITLAISTVWYFRGLRTGPKLALITVISLSSMIGIWILAKYLFKPFFVSPSQPGWFMDALIRYQIPEIYSKAMELPANSILLTLVCLLCISGFYLALFAVSVIYDWQKSKQSDSNKYFMLPILVIILYSLSIWFLPQASSGNDAEFSHRPLALVYIFVFIWSIAIPLYYLDSVVNKTNKYICVAIILATSLTVSYFFPSDAVPNYANMKFPKPLHDITRKIVEENHNPNQRVLDTGYDPYSFVTAFSQQFSYLSRYKDFKDKIEDADSHYKIHTLATALHTKAEAIYQADSYNDARALALQNNIRWLIKRPEHQLRWRNDHALIADISGYELYDFQR